MITFFISIVSVRFKVLKQSIADTLREELAVKNFLLLSLIALLSSNAFAIEPYNPQDLKR